MFEQGISKANKVNNTFFIVAIQSDKHMWNGKRLKMPMKFLRKDLNNILNGC